MSEKYHDEMRITYQIFKFPNLNSFKNDLMGETAQGVTC